jgi:hypothetical protein
VNDAIASTTTTVILRSRALARRLEGSPQAPRLWPSFEARPEKGEHLRMTAVLK